MRHALAIILLGCVYSVCQSQQLTATAGGTSTTQGITVSWSLGETIVGIASNNVSQASIGFQQNYNLIVIGLEESDPVAFSLFPNPAKDFVVLELKRDYNQGFELTVFSLSGSVVIQKSIGASTRSIELDISHLTSGHYEVVLLSRHAKMASLSFIKL